jgi:hypothetical protein
MVATGKTMVATGKAMVATRKAMDGYLNIDSIP